MRSSAPCSWIATVLLGGLIVACAAKAFAGDAPAIVPGSGGGTRRAATIVFGGGSGASGALKKAFRTSLSRVAVDVTFGDVSQINPRVVAESPVGPASTVKVWLDLSDRRAVTLYVAHGEGIFVRRLKFDRGFDSVALDFMDVVVTTAVEAALAGQQTGMRRDEFRRSLEDPVAVPFGSSPEVAPAPVARATAATPPATQASPSPPAPPTQPASGALPPASAPPPASPPSVPSVPPPMPAVRLVASAPASPPSTATVRWSVAAFYEGTLIQSTSAMHGPGIVVHAERGTVRAGLSLHGRLPYDRQGEGATVSIAPEGLRLSVGGLRYLSPTLVAMASLAAGVDFVHVGTVTAGADLAPRPAFWAIDPLVRPSVGLEHRLGRWCWGVVVGTDVNLIRSRYVIADGERAAMAAPQAVWTPWRWRPFAAVLVGTTL